MNTAIGQYFLWCEMNIEELKAFFKDYSIADVKEKLEAVLVDTSIPLEERWELFLMAPPEFKNREPWVWHPEVEKTIDRISWYDLFNINRGAVIESHYIITAIEESIEYREGSEQDPDYPSPWDALCKPGIKEALMEEILGANMYSFCFDW